MSLQPSDELSNKKVLLGVTGGVAAYKAIELCRRLIELGCDVTPVLSRSALNFVGTHTFRAICNKEVVIDLWTSSDPMLHTSLAKSIDIIVVVPTTANFIGKVACGLANDALSTIVLASRSPVMLFPAMHTEMWENPSVVTNVETLRGRGIDVINPDSGALSAGDIGIGRLGDTNSILGHIRRKFAQASRIDQVTHQNRLDVSDGSTEMTRESEPLRGLRILVTLGGTREAIDPVRFIGNRSSGRQGLALLSACKSLGASGIAVSTVDVPKSLGFEVITVDTALEMYDAVSRHLSEVDILIMCAAVSDYRVAKSSSNKIKRSGEALQIELIENPDILKSVTTRIAEEKLSVITVGFAAETENVLQNGKAKLIEKGVDLLVLNDVCEPGAGFDGDTNAVWILDTQGNIQRIELGSKDSIALAILTRILNMIYRE